MTDGICPQCERALPGHTFHQWTAGVWRAYCRPDLTQESPISDQSTLDTYRGWRQ